MLWHKCIVVSGKIIYCMMYGNTGQDITISTTIGERRVKGTAYPNTSADEVVHTKCKNNVGM